MDAYLTYLGNFSFSGRASRSEYWTVYLGNFIISLAVIFTMVAFRLPHTAIVLNLFFLATAVQSFALGVRRLHDIDYSGWMILVAFIPIIGILWMITVGFLPGTKGANKFGPDPVSPVDFKQSIRGGKNHRPPLNYAHLQNKGNPPNRKRA